MNHSLTNTLKNNLLSGFALVIITFLVYSNTLGNDFTLDDHQVILNNPVLKGNLGDILRSIDTTSDMQLLPYYRPLTYLTFFIDGKLHGFNTFYIRLFNVLLHSVNSFLVYLFALSFLKDRQAGLLVGLLFALHPLHTEGVNFNAGGRNTMLVCFFVLLTYLLHREGIIKKKFMYTLAACICYLAGLFSKEAACMIIPFIVALEIISYRDTGSLSKTSILLRMIPYGIATVIYLVMRWSTLSRFGLQTGIIPGVGSTVPADSFNMPAELSARLINDIYIIPRYLLTIIKPNSLATHYVVPDDLQLIAIPLLCGWLIVIATAIWLLGRGRSRTTLYGLAWLIAFWLPVSGIAYFPSAPFADRYLYIPAIGLWLILADQCTTQFPSSHTIRKYCVFAALVILSILAILTVKRNMDWKNNLTLYTRFVSQFPENIHGYAGLGSAYYNRRTGDDLQKAELLFEKVLEMNPYFPMIHTLIGNIKLDHGEFSDALKYYTEALGIFPFDKEARINRAITLEKTGKRQEALSDYKSFLTTPGNFYITGSREYALERVRELSAVVGAN